MSRLDRGIVFFDDLLNEQDLGATSGNLDDVDASDLLDDDASLFSPTTIDSGQYNDIDDGIQLCPRDENSQDNLDVGAESSIFSRWYFRPSSHARQYCHI